MASYETEHNINSSRNDQSGGAEDEALQSARIDLSSFYSHLNYVNTSSGSSTAPPPRPSDVSAAYRMLANAYQVMQGERTGVVSENTTNQSTQQSAASSGDNTVVLERMIDLLIDTANDPPRSLQGVPRTFFDELERVSKQELEQLERKGSEKLLCPICYMPFLDDAKPLVVRLRCSKLHLFDLECLHPWLTLNSTCPLDRQNLLPERKLAPAGTSQNFRDYLLGGGHTEEQKRAFTQTFATESMSEEVDDMYG